MKFNAFILLSILSILTSCKCQNKSQPINRNNNNLSSVLAQADTVSELSNNIMIIFQDSKNIYWFGSWEDGLYRYDGKNILHFTTKHGLPSNRIDEIKEDKTGNIYLNTINGICKFDGNNFTKLIVAANLLNVWKLETDDLWFKDGWNSGFIFRYDGNFLYKLQLPKIKSGEDYILKNPTNPNPYTVYTIYKDTNGNIWFGTAVLGVCRYNGITFDWISEVDVTEIHDGPSNGVRSIIEDKDGYFWFNTSYRYNVYNKNNVQNIVPTQKEFYIREKGIGSLDEKKDGNLNEYLSITKDNNNDIWIATYNTGAFRYDGKNIIHYTVKSGSENITLFSVYKDNFGGIWLGTHQSGAFKFNGITFERFK